MQIEKDEDDEEDEDKDGKDYDEELDENGESVGTNNGNTDMSANVNNTNTNTNTDANGAKTTSNHKPPPNYANINTYNSDDQSIILKIAFHVDLTKYPDLTITQGTPN